MERLRALAFVLLAAAAAAQTPPELTAPRRFASPDAAIEALRAVAEKADKDALRDLFGPGYGDLLTGDEKQDKANFRHFAREMSTKTASEADGDGKLFLEVGARGWPFPIPLVRGADGQWSYDTDAGKEEILNRHVGKDELRAIGLCRAYASGRRDLKDVPGDKPAHGYLFKAGGDGYVLLAYPEEWGKSGVMTFVVASDGKVYRRDLGEQTAQLAPALGRFAPSDDWELETEEGIPADAPDHGPKP